jgi:L-rhamnose mutarotase
VEWLSVTRRLCYALDLVNDAALIREYCRMHEPGSVWPAGLENDQWQAYMAKFQRPLPGAAPGEKWLALRRIFELADHMGLFQS